ncbi:MAG: hypothetical protein MJE66_07225 [Proteobacteria bacterium]|nr:hypothetical protein [Pseudomonadota bacterium]
MAESAAEFRAKIREPGVKALEIAQFLDGLSHPERVAAIRGTTRSDQRRLWELAEGFESVRLTDLVRPETPALQTVRHFGKNTLPAFTEFEKRFCRPEDDDSATPRTLYGFNYQTLAPLTGPGYFVAVDDERRPEVLIDYRRVPSEHPVGWPEVQINERGLSRFVYGHMVDTLRRLSEHVTIGSAARKGKDLGSWFLLCREA